MADEQEHVILVPVSMNRVYGALLEAVKDYRALSTAKELLEGDLCEDCLAKFESKYSERFAVADAMAKVLNLECPKNQATIRPQTWGVRAYNISDGECKCAGHHCLIGIEGEE